MFGHRRRNSRGSIFSLDGIRSWSRAANPSMLQRSATDPVLGIPYHEHKVASQEVQKQNKPAPTSLRMWLRSASERAATKLKTLGRKRPAKALERLPEKTAQQKSAVATDCYETKPHQQKRDDGTGLRPTRSTPNILHPRINPLSCHSDVTAMAERPIFAVPAVPRIEVSLEANAEIEDDNDIYLDDLHDAVIYSPSIGDLNSYARETPSPARSSDESPLSTTEKNDLSTSLIALNRATMNDNGRSNVSDGLAHSMTGLNIRENISGLYHKAAGYNKLAEPQKKGFEKIGMPRLLKELGPNSLSQPETPEKRGVFTRLGSNKDLLTPMKTSKSTTTLNTPQFTSEKTLLADEFPCQHTPKNPSPLRRVYSSDSLNSLEHEQLRQWM